MWPFSKKQAVETRSSGSGFTGEMIGARAAYITGRVGTAELTATVQGCVSLWAGGLSLADVSGTDMLTRRTLALAARSLALRGEAVFLIGDTLVPCSDWSLSTRNGAPVAYRVTVPNTGGGESRTVLAAEVLHFRIGCDISSPYIGQAPLKRASLTAGMLSAVESALAEAFENMPLGSQIVPFPESPNADLAQIGREFRGARGKLLLRESVNVQAAGGPVPAQDWRPSDVTPDLSKAMTRETLSAARDSVSMAFGILPGLANAASTGPLVREAQRHLAQWTLQPIGAMISEEASDKLGGEVKLDVMQPLQAFDIGGRARALKAIIGALGEAKSLGVDPAAAFALVNLPKE